MSKFQLVLGSGSPRRKELISHIGIPFEIITSDIEEISHKDLPSDIAEDLAFQKANAVFKDIKDKKENPLVVGSDTIVCFDNKILGKPADRKEAKQTLQTLSGQTHEVITGVALISKEKTKLFHLKSQVTFRGISPELMEHYLDSEDGMDKAGAYGIQGAGLLFVTHVEGSYSNVVGFPLDYFYQELQTFIGDHSDNWRALFE